MRQKSRMRNSKAGIIWKEAFFFVAFCYTVGIRTAGVDEAAIYGHELVGGCGNDNIFRGDAKKTFCGSHVANLCRKCREIM